MAKDPKDFERGDSFIKKAIIGTPMAVGGAIGISRMVRDLQSAQEAGVETVARKPLAVVESIGTATSLSQAMVDKQARDRAERLSYMERNWGRFKTTEGMKVLKRSWKEALHFADPVSRGRFMSFAERVQAMQDPADVFNAINRTFQQNNSNLMGRVFDRLETNVAAFEIHAATGLSPKAGMFSGFKPSVQRNLSIESLPSNLRGYVERIQKELKGPIGISRYTRPGVFATEHEVFRIGFGMGISDDIVDLMVPITKRGVFMEGEALRTRYISPDVGIAKIVGGKAEIERMSRHEFLLRQFEREIVPEIKAGRLTSPYEIEKAVQAMRTDILHRLETVPNLPKELEDMVHKTYRRRRGAAMDILFDIPEEELEKRRKRALPGWMATTRIGTEEEMRILMTTLQGKDRIFGGVSPANIAEGRRATFNWSKIVSGMPQAYNWGRRPEQFLRQYGLTEQAAAMLEKEGYRADDVFATGAMRKLYGRGGAMAPHLRTLYLTPAKHMELLERMGIGEGEALMREGLRDMLEQRVISTTHVVGIDDATLNAINEGTIRKGQVLGMVAETGKPYVVEDPSIVKKAVTFTSESRGDYATIFEVNSRRLASHNKWFNDLKVLARFVDDFVINKTGVEELGLQGRMAGVGWDVVATTEDLTKNPALLGKQIVSGMHDIMAGDPRFRNMKTQAFIERPMKYMQTWARMATTPAEGYNQRAFIQRAMRFALEQGQMSPAEFGLVFGAVPEVEKKWKGMAGQVIREFESNPAMRRAYIEAMGEGKVIGKAQLFWGGPSELRGAGGLGSLEPRMFEMLSSGTYGDTGKALAREFTERAIYTDPEKRALSDALTKSMASIAGRAERQAGEAVFDIAARDVSETSLAAQFTDFLQEGGGWMRPQKGAKEIFVPPMETLRAMQPFTTAGGQSVRGVVPDIFYGLMYRGQELVEGKIGEEAYQKRVNEAMAAMWEQGAPAGKGGGAYLRGKVAGSRFLEIASVIDEGQRPTKMNEVLISKQRMADMMAEMQDTLSKEEFAAMEARYAETGTLEAMVARHPFIGQFSTQPVTVRAVDVGRKFDPNMIAISERHARLTFGFAGEKAEETIVKMTPLVGMAADKDADLAALFLVSPKNSKRLRDMARNTDNAFTSAYTQHQIRMQMIKAKKAASGALGLTQIEQMAADVTKLGVTQSHVPKLSIELSTARQAVGHALSGQAEADARFLLEWLEQNPISAKHMSAREVSQGGLAQLDVITQSLQRTQQADERILIGEIENIVKDNHVAKRLLKEDILVSDARMVDDNTKLAVDRRLRAIDVDSTVRNIMDARRKFEKSGEARLAQLMHARGPTIRPVQDLPRYLNTLSQVGTKTFSGVAKGMTATANMLQAAGRTALKYYKPLALGFAGSLALAMTLSSPEETIGPGSSLANVNINMNQGKAAGSMKPADMLPAGQAVGNPSVPGMMSVPQAAIAPPVQSDRTRVVARTRSIVNSQNLAERMNGMTRGTRSVNLNIRENRSRSKIPGGNNLY